MTTDEVRILIDKILSATKPEDVFSSAWKADYRKFSLWFHPDGEYGHFQEADAAFRKLTDFKNILENGQQFFDESGTIICKDNIIFFKGDKNQDILKKSYDNFWSIKSANDPQFDLYIPEKMEYDGTQLKVFLKRRSVSVLGIQLEEKHVRWVLNRLLEAAGYICNCGMNHNAISPYSVWITPEDHGIQIISFYHTKPNNSKLESINGLIFNWYGEYVKTEKRSKIEIDIDLAKIFAGSLLIGQLSNDPWPQLKNKIDPNFWNFLIKTSKSGFVDIIEYKDYIKSLGPSTFYKLDL